MIRVSFAVALALALPALAKVQAKVQAPGLPDRVSFQKGHLDIPAGQRQRLDAVKAYLQSNAGSHLRLEGHHDAKGKHAAVVARWLIEQGIDCQRLSAVGYAKGIKTRLGGAYVSFASGQTKAKAGGHKAANLCGAEAGKKAKAPKQAKASKQAKAPKAAKASKQGKAGKAPAQQSSPAEESGGESQQAAAPGTGGKRAAIIAKAASYIGTVADQGGSGGKRKGWEILKDFFDTALNMDIFKDGKAKAEIPKSGGKYASWCGIFALAAAKKSGAVAQDVKWRLGARIQGLEFKNGNKGPKPGDIIVMEMKGLWHHAIVESIDGDTFRTIDGNSWDQKTGHSQTICRQTRKRGEINGWYDTVPGE